MASLRDLVPLTADPDYRVCNGATPVDCSRFVMYGHTVWVHRPVDDKGKGRVAGWQFSTNGVPISYLGVPGLPKLDAVIGFVMRSFQIGQANWERCASVTLVENQHRLDAARHEK